MPRSRLSQYIRALPISGQSSSESEEVLMPLVITGCCFFCSVIEGDPVQWLSCVQLFATPWTAACQASLSITNSQSSLKLSSSSRSSTRDGSTGSFPGSTVVKNPPANVGDARECRFYPWIKKIPQSRKWSPNPVSLLGKSHG